MSVHAAFKDLSAPATKEIKNNYDPDNSVGLNTMSYYVNPVETDNALYCGFEGKVTATEAGCVRDSMKRLFDDYQWGRVVLDATRLRFFPSALELLTFCESLCLDLPQSTWIALVVRLDQCRQAQFVNIIARNRGLMLKCFSDVIQARNWVKQSSVKPLNRHSPKVMPS